MNETVYASLFRTRKRNARRINDEIDIQRERARMYEPKEITTDISDPDLL